MNRDELIEEYFSVVRSERLYSSRGNLEFYLNFLFKEICFNGRDVLDIGSGAGLFSFYAACRGAREVVSLEPQAAGSGAGVREKYRKVQSRLKDKVKVELSDQLLQDFDSPGKRFDVILLHDSINHLHEQACINLKHDSRAVGIYNEFFKKLNLLGKPGCRLIVVDYPRLNFFDLLGLTNPFHPEIEWPKHQSPNLWAKLLSRHGFINPRIAWRSPNRLRAAGRLIMGNRVASFFIGNRFCLTMEKSRHP